MVGSIQTLAGPNNLTTQIFQGGLEPRPWQTFLRCLRIKLDCDATILWLKPAAPGVTPITIWDRSRAPFNELEGREESREHGRTAHLDVVGSSLGRTNSLLSLDEAKFPTDFSKHEYFRRMQPYGTRYDLRMYMEPCEGWICHFGLVNGPDKPSFGEKEKTILLNFRQHLEQALKQYRMLQSGSALRRVYEDGLGAMAIGSIILNKRGRVLSLSGAAGGILGKTACMSIVNDRLICQRSQNQSAFDKVVKAALAHGESCDPAPYVDVISLTGATQQTLQMVVRPVLDIMNPLGENEPAVVVHFVDVNDDAGIHEERLAQLFDLPAYLARLTAGLAAGRDLAETAEDLGITLSTARTYLKQIFERTGVTRQAELIRLVLSNRGLLGGGGFDEAFSQRY